MLQQIAQMRALDGGDVRWQPKHLVEIAIVQVTLPVHADHAAANHGVQVVRLVGNP